LAGGLPARRLGTREAFEALLDEHLRLGDSRAACVISTETLLVAAYTDEFDCVILLAFPPWLVEEHQLEVGSRLLTVNTYGRGQRLAPDLVPGPRDLGRWTNFYPVIAEFVSDDVQRIKERKAEIAEEEWQRCDRMGREQLQRFPNRRRDGSPFRSGQPVQELVAEAEPGGRPLPQPSPSVLEEFLVERTLGEGGMGKVFLVRSRATGMRFAAKRSRFSDPVGRRNFLAELQSWINLPEHPQVVACRFFRTVGEEVCIFAEYVEGCSLDRWIRTPTPVGWQAARDYVFSVEVGPEEEDPDPRRRRLEPMLDVAIQFAWGLHVVHELGLVHQDVKPANAILSTNGIVKITDFGLARARAGAGEPAAPAGASILVSSGGFSLAYCSPEQTMRQRLTRKTDIWSFGVSILEMFNGAVSWKLGAEAAQALETYVQSGPANPQLPAMPPGLVDVVQGCLRQNPAERWPTMAAVAAAPLAKAALLRNSPHTALVLKLCDAGISLYEKLVGERPDLEGPLAAAYLQRAAVYADVLGDSARAAWLYDRGVPLLEKRVLHEGDFSLARELSGAYLRRAQARWRLGEYKQAAASCDAALSLCETLIHQGRIEFLRLLPHAYLEKARALDALKNPESATPLFDRARTLAERMVAESRNPAVVADLIDICTVTAHAWKVRERFREAVALCDRAIALAEELVNQRQLKRWMPHLARAYFQKAMVIAWDRTIWRRDWWRIFRRLWGLITANRPLPWSAAVALCEQSMDVFRRTIMEGQRRFQGELAQVRAYRATILITQGKDECAELEQALEILKAEVAAGRVGLKAPLQRGTKFLDRYRRFRRFRPIKASFNP
jgi:serine/threonine protein kinase